MTVRSTVRATLAMCAVLAAGACSDSTDDADRGTGGVTAYITAVPEELTPAAYVEYLNGICTNPDLGGDIGDPVGASSTTEEVDARYDQIETRLDLMRQLPVPDGDEQAFDEVVQAYDRVLLAMDELSAAMSDDDTQGAVILASALDGLRADVNELVREYGIEACGL